MKAIYPIFLVSLFLAGCSFPPDRPYKPASSLEELKEIVEASYKSGNSRPVELLVLKDSTPKEVLEQNNAIIDWIFSGTGKGYQLEGIKIFPVGEYSPEMDLPGELNGRELRFYPKPKWWLRLTAKQSKSSTSMMELPISEENGEFFICGADYK